MAPDSSVAPAGRRWAYATINQECRLMTKFLCLVLAFFLLPTGSVAQALACTKFVTETPRLDVNEALKGKTIIEEIAVGRLFYREEASGACLPTSERYLVTKFPDGQLRIEARIDGHTLGLKFVNLRSRHFLAVTYFSGGNQYLLKLFQLNEDKITPVKGMPVASNLRAIEIQNDRIVVKNQVTDNDGNRAIVTEHYTIDGDMLVKVVPVSGALR